MLHVKSEEHRVTVKCLVHHPALLLHPLIDFVVIRRNSEYKHSSFTDYNFAPQITNGLFQPLPEMAFGFTKPCLLKSTSA